VGLPLVYHNNGRDYAAWANRGDIYFALICERFFRAAAARPPLRRPPELDIVLVHNHREPPIAQRGLEALGVRDYTRLGDPAREWSHMLKISLLLDHLEHHSRAPFVLYLDADDTLLWGDPGEALERFLEHFRCGVLFNGEKTPSPGSQVRRLPRPRDEWRPGGYSNPRNWIEIPKEDRRKLAAIEDFDRRHFRAPAPHLNAGCFIGAREAVIDVLHAVNDLSGFVASWDHTGDDQRLMREVQRLRYPEVQTDHQSLIFQALHRITARELLVDFNPNPWQVRARRLAKILRAEWRRARRRSGEVGERLADLLARGRRG